jgi:hypothetical protein
MSAARGDSKPCTRNGCLGTMQFGRESLPHGPTMRATDGKRGWNCSENAEHFQLASEQRAPELGSQKSARGTSRP